MQILRAVAFTNRLQCSKDRNKTELKLAAVVFGIIALWFIAWTPYAIVALLGISKYRFLLTPFGSMLPAFFCKTAACLNPYVYALTHPRFRQEIQRMLMNFGKKKNLQYVTSFTRGATTRRIVREFTISEEHQQDETPQWSNCKENWKLCLKRFLRFMILPMNFPRWCFVQYSWITGQIMWEKC